MERKSSPEPKLTIEDLKEIVRAYQQAPSHAGFEIGVPASQFMIQDSSRQQELISQSVRMRGGGHSPRVGNSLSGLRSSVMDGRSDPRLSFEPLTQGGNGAMRSRLLAAKNGLSG
jgi:hypothetical protein